MSPKRQTIFAPNAPAAVGPYCHAVRSGDLLFCSGQIALDPESGSMAANDVSGQADQCLKNLEAVCESAGSDLSQAIKITIYMTDLGEFNNVNDVYQAFFSVDPPARVTIGVSQLPKDALVEIDAVVALSN